MVKRPASGEIRHILSVNRMAAAPCYLPLNQRIAAGTTAKAQGQTCRYPFSFTPAGAACILWPCTV